MLTVYMHVLGQEVYVYVFVHLAVCGTVKLGQKEVHILWDMMQIQRNTTTGLAGAGNMRKY